MHCRLQTADCGIRPSAYQRKYLVSGVVGILGPPQHGDPHPHIASILGMGVPISLIDMRTPLGVKTLGVQGPLVTRIY